jgi:hypothetical protein
LQHQNRLPWVPPSHAWNFETKVTQKLLGLKGISWEGRQLTTAPWKTNETQLLTVKRNPGLQDQGTPTDV